MTVGARHRTLADSRDLRPRAPSSRLIRSFILLMGVASCAFAGDDKVPLPLELPRPLFEGTPVPINVPNLEAPRKGPRPVFMAPRGTVNLARGRTVTASDSAPVVGEVGYVTDGDKSGSEGSWVEFGPGIQWVQVDLGAPAQVQAIVVWHYHEQACVYHDVVVQVADDPGFKDNVRTLFNNDSDNAVGLGKGRDLAYIETYEGKLIDAKGEAARYVRLYSDGSTLDELNRYLEVEVYGLPAKQPHSGP